MAREAKGAMHPGEAGYGNNKSSVKRPIFFGQKMESYAIKFLSRLLYWIASERWAG